MFSVVFVDIETLNVSSQPYRYDPLTPGPTHSGEHGAAEEQGAKEGPPVWSLEPNGLELIPHLELHLLHHVLLSAGRVIWDTERKSVRTQHQHPEVLLDGGDTHRSGSGRC